MVTAGDVVFYGTMDGWFRALDATTGEKLWEFKRGSGIIGQPTTFKGPDGKQYVAILSGVGGWAGAVVAGDLDIRDPTARLGFVNAMRDCRSTRPREARLCVRPSLRRRVGLAIRMAIGVLLRRRWLAHSIVAAQPARTRSRWSCASPPIRTTCRSPTISGEGFENKIAELIATDLGATIEYTWWAQRRGFFRETLKHGECDIVLGVPADFERALRRGPTTDRPTCSSTRTDRNLDLHSLDDPALRS